MNAVTVNRWMSESAAAIAEQRDYLTQLDAAIGDADHGANMNRGFAAVQAELAEADGGEPPGKLLVTAGSTLVSTVGGASGPLWGTALRRAGKSLGDAETIEPEALAHGPRGCGRQRGRTGRRSARRQDHGRRVATCGRCDESFAGRRRGRRHRACGCK